MIQIMAILLPLVGGFHRYSVSYGYRGMSKRESYYDAVGVAFILAVISLLILILGEH